MARVLIKSQAWGVVFLPGPPVQPASGTLVSIKNTDGSAATLWSAQTGGTSTTTDQTTNTSGEVPKWVEEGEYDVIVNAVTTRVEAVTGSNVHPSLTLRKDTSVANTPLLNLYAAAGGFQLGIDTSNHGGGKDFFLGVHDSEGGPTTDIIFINHDDQSIGLGMTPPSGSYRVEIAGSDSNNSYGELSIRVGPTQTAKPFVVHDSTPNDLLWVSADGSVSGKDDGLKVRARSDASNRRTLTLTPSGVGGQEYGFIFQADLLELTFREYTNAHDVWSTYTDGKFRIKTGLLHTGTLGFFGTDPGTTKQTVSGAKGGNAALGSLLTALANYGLITDSSTA